MGLTIQQDVGHWKVLQSGLFSLLIAQKEFFMDPIYVVKNSAEIPTPALLVYRDLVAENIDRSVAMVGDVGRLRPHVKTHKTRQIIAMQQAVGIHKYKCATIAEAEMLGQCRAKDVLIAYPLIGPHIRRLVSLCQAYPETDFKALVDDPGAAQALAKAMTAAGLEIEVLIDLDVGMHRTGTASIEKIIALYESLDRWAGVRPGGIHAYDGHNHQPDPRQRDQVAQGCLEQTRALKEQLEQKGLPVPRLVMGGTPSFPFYARAEGVEASPGTCFLHDWGYFSNFPDLPFRPAALLLSRIISIPTDRIITLDLGHKAIAADPPGDRGKIWSLDGPTRFVNQHEEHWMVEVPDTGSFRVGQEVYVMPGHICPTCALHKVLYVIDGQGQWVDTWLVTARDRQITI